MDLSALLALLICGNRPRQLISESANLHQQFPVSQWSKANVLRVRGMIFYIKFYDLFANCSNSIESFELSKVQYLISSSVTLAPVVFKICDNLDFEKKLNIVHIL